MFSINEGSSISGEFKNDSRIHEHDFISVGAEEKEKSIICKTCGLVYCEKCGKLVTIIGKNHTRHNISITSKDLLIRKKQLSIAE
jgi:hypothetical protein